jgi:hypothetical protein
MLVDASKYVKTYQCGKIVAEYLMYSAHLPVLDAKNDFFYFLDSKKLQDILGKMPLWLKVIDKLTPR